MPWRIPIRAVWDHLAVVALLMASLSSALTVYLNDRRADEIQRDRLASCVRGYDGIRLVFEPFVAGAPADRVRLFNNRIEELKTNCGQQTGVKETP